MFLRALLDQTHRRTVTCRGPSVALSSSLKPAFRCAFNAVFKRCARVDGVLRLADFRQLWSAAGCPPTVCRSVCAASRRDTRAADQTHAVADAVFHAMDSGAGDGAVLMARFSSCLLAAMEVPLRLSPLAAHCLPAAVPARCAVPVGCPGLAALAPSLQQAAGVFAHAVLKHANLDVRAVDPELRRPRTRLPWDRDAAVRPDPQELARLAVVVRTSSSSSPSGQSPNTTQLSLTDSPAPASASASVTVAVEVDDTDAKRRRASMRARAVVPQGCARSTKVPYLRASQPPPAAMSTSAVTTTTSSTSPAAMAMSTSMSPAAGQFPSQAAAAGVTAKCACCDRHVAMRQPWQRTLSRPGALPEPIATTAPPVAAPSTVVHGAMSHGLRQEPVRLHSSYLRDTDHLVYCRKHAPRRRRAPCPPSTAAVHSFSSSGSSSGAIPTVGSALLAQCCGAAPRTPPRPGSRAMSLSPPSTTPPPRPSSHQHKHQGQHQGQGRRLSSQSAVVAGSPPPALSASTPMRVGSVSPVVPDDQQLTAAVRALQSDLASPTWLDELD